MKQLFLVDKASSWLPLLCQTSSLPIYGHDKILITKELIPWSNYSVLSRLVYLQFFEQLTCFSRREKEDFLVLTSPVIKKFWNLAAVDDELNQLVVFHITCFQHIWRNKLKTPNVFAYFDCSTNTKHSYQTTRWSLSTCASIKLRTIAAILKFKWKSLHEVVWFTH